METEGSNMLGCNCLCFLFLCKCSREAFVLFFWPIRSQRLPMYCRYRQRRRDASKLLPSPLHSLLPALLFSTPVHSVPLLYHTPPSYILIDSTLVCLTRPHWNRRYPTLLYLHSALQLLDLSLIPSRTALPHWIHCLTLLLCSTQPHTLLLYLIGPHSTRLNTLPCSILF